MQARALPKPLARATRMLHPAQDPLVILDIRLHNSVPLFRTPGMTRFMLLLTELGGATVLSLAVLGIALLALARGRRRLAATFVLALAGTGLISTMFKALVGNARPIDAIISAHEASFPSGHMLSGTVAYGLLAALLTNQELANDLRALVSNLRAHGILFYRDSAAKIDNTAREQSKPARTQTGGR